MAEQTAQTVAFHQVGVAVSKHPFGQLVVVVVMILLVRHISEVQREHPTVAVDDVLRQTGQRVIDETLVVAVGVFHRHQREEGGIFIRTVFCDHQRRKTQNYRTNQRSTRPGSLLNQICSLSNNTGSASSSSTSSSGNKRP